ncbi:MAG: signal recognition particle-docking protein FtsY [Planctomycetes bacterium]|nr:signal recognition particle-docking protein FtsY [Planctomycetota bacterium]
MVWSVLEKLKKGLQKTREKLTSRLQSLFTFGRKIDEELLEQLEEVLLAADIGVRPVSKLIGEVREAYRTRKIQNQEEVPGFLKQQLKESLGKWDTKLKAAPQPPMVILVTGVNGTGKTTSIAKLAAMFDSQGKKVLLAASDTFRAAAIEQLEIWSKRAGVGVIKHQTGADPAAVAFDALEAAASRGVDVVLIDTAGRLHTHDNLMKELNKIRRVVEKRIPGAPHEVLLVLDATTGQNAIVQAKQFKHAVAVTGIFLAKLDGTAKGGVVLGMRDEVDIPVKFVGIGEKLDDIEPFNAEAFVDAIFE